MLFSVIIPAYNCKAFLRETVRQVRGAGLWDYEILLINDGSTDGTAQICDALAAEHCEVRCIHQPNAGVSAARNRGISEAQGEYILFFDADDGVDAGGLQNAARRVQQEKPDMLIFGMSFDYYLHGRLYRRDELLFPETGVWNRQQWTAAFEELYRSNALSPVWNKFIRRGLLQTHNIRFAGNLIEMEDFVFSADCLKHCDRVSLMPEAIYRYRQSENERNTYNRLCRVESLSDYMTAFTNCMESMIRETQPEEPICQSMRKVVEEIYLNFLHERIRFASPTEIRRTAEDLLAGAFAEAAAREAPVLFNRISNKQWYIIWLHNCLRRFRHWIAVRVKYLHSLGR